MPLSKDGRLDYIIPKLSTDSVEIPLYLGHGRFHLKSAMVQDCFLPPYRYDPYARKLAGLKYGREETYGLRRDVISSASKEKMWGLILGSFGRPGSSYTMVMIKNIISQQETSFVSLLLSNVFPGTLALMSDINCRVQIAYPRLSIDWGYALLKPLLNVKMVNDG